MALTSIIGEDNLRQMAELISDLPAGDFAEIGVFRGGSAKVLYEVAERSGRVVHLFDTFVGTPFHTPQWDRHLVDQEFASPMTIDELKTELPEAKVYIGVYPFTHPDDMPPLAFVHCDCDQYISYTAVIEKMWPLVVPGGILLFDDYPYLLGAKRAVEEHFNPADLRQCGTRFYVVKDAAP